jgi:hypothetical protein
MEERKRKFKVTHPLMAWRKKGESREFARHDVGEHVHLTEEEAQAMPANHIEPVEEVEWADEN